MRSRTPLSPEEEDDIRAAFGRAIGDMGTRIERATVRFDDLNGPRGGVDIVCRIKLVLSGHDSLVVESRGRNTRHAFRLSVPRISRTLRRSIGRSGGGRTPAPTRAAARPPAGRGAPTREPYPGSLIGRRVGQGERNLELALARPEKQRRDHYVDTAAPGVSASDRRAGGPMTARRNTKRSRAGMIAALEDSRTTPSRKSTRRSTGRSKSATALTTRTRRQSHTPRSRQRKGK